MTPIESPSKSQSSLVEAMLSRSGLQKYLGGMARRLTHAPNRFKNCAERSDCTIDLFALMCCFCRLQAKVDAVYEECKQSIENALSDA